MISQITKTEIGETVGYSRNHKITKPTTIATIPVGYADGISRLLGNNNGYVLINSKKAPIIGSVCMDMLMVDISEVKCSEGDSVILFGNKPTIQEIATLTNTIPYEVLSSISRRVKRLYFKE